MLMGSPNDREKMAPAVATLGEFGIDVDERVLSAHRTPDDVAALARSAREEGYVAFICGAGMAAHLAGAVAAHTTLPVVGVPLSGGALNGVDALYATVQMPRGVPVATVAVDGALNAALLVVQMLAISDADLAREARRGPPPAGGELGVSGGRDRVASGARRPPRGHTARSRAASWAPSRTRGTPRRSSSGTYGRRRPRRRRCA